ncbi:MAG: kelch repeat-containing protein [Cyanobacteria bacterium J06639_14]
MQTKFRFYSIATFIAVGMVTVHPFEESFHASETSSYRSNESTFFNDILTFHAPNQPWTPQSVAHGPAPLPRAMSCAIYHGPTNALYVFGGVSFAANFSFFNYDNDPWKFDFNTNTWTELPTITPLPSARASSGCALIDNDIYGFSGGGENFSIDNELWRYTINSGTWTLLQANTLEALNRLPGRIQSNDVWVYAADSNTWTKKDVKGKPSNNTYFYDLIEGRWGEL